MRVSTGYVARETAGNLRRNLVMTFSAIITMAVSLSALGGVLIMRQAINKASIQWRGGVEMAIFLQPTVSANETAAIGHELASTPGVKKYHFVDKPQAYQEFKEIFGGNNDIVGVLGVSDMPPSYRVVPTKAQDISELGRQFQGQPGVLQVSYAQQEIDALLHQFKQLRLIGVCPRRRRDGRRHRPDREHHPAGHLRPPAGGGGHEAGRGDQLVHPGAVHARGADPGDRRAPSWPSPSPMPSATPSRRSSATRRFSAPGSCS